MSIEAQERHLVRSGYELDLNGDVYRHPEWLGWVRYDEGSGDWECMDANSVKRWRPNLVEALRESGAPALVGVPS